MLVFIINMILLSLLYAEPNYVDFDIVENNNPYQEKLIFHTFGGGNNKYMSILNTNLQPYWQINSDEKGLDFKKNGDFLTYFEKVGGQFNASDRWIIMNSQMQEIDTVKCTSGLTDYHDMRVLENGNYIIQAYDTLFVNMQEIVPNGNPSATIIGVLRIQEFNQNGDILLDWFALDHLDISNYTNLNLSNQQITFMHGNSIEVDDDENLIISNRRSSEIIKIDRNTGDIIWIAGGPLNEFEIIGDELNGFSKQHDVRRLENGNILVFDNGNNHSPSISRVIEYDIDEIGKTLTLIWEYRNPYGQESLSMGSSQRLPNGNTLISWGNIAGLAGGKIMEVTHDNEIVLEIQFDSQMPYKVRKDSWNFDIPMASGDINLDEVLNILDILVMVNTVLDGNAELNALNLYKIDLNRDYSFNVLDIVELVNRILY